MIEDERSGGDWFGRIPGETVGGGGAVWLPAVAGDADVVVVGEAVEAVGRAVGGCLQIKAAASLVVEVHRNSRLVVGAGGIDAHPSDGSILAVVGDAPGAGLGGDQGLVAVKVVLEELRGLGDVDTARHGRNFVRTVGWRRERGGGDERGVDCGLRVIELVAAEEILAESVSWILVDGDGRVGVREATDRRDAGNGARGVLVQAVRGVLGDDGRPGLGVVGCRYAVADGVVGKILVEAADGQASLGAAGGDDFAP